MPTPTDTYVPVVDISRHQGTVDFAVMRATGVEGVIFRSNHAHIADDRCQEYVNAARQAGWRDDQLGFYTFCNPKRASGAASGKAFVDTVRKVFGRTDTLLMLDIEGYETESGGGPVIYGPPFATWIREHIDAVHQLAPDATLIAYSNASFWNPRVGDQQLAESLEWIVPRYPVYNLGGYATNPLPGPGGWAGWAWARAPKGPIPPSGVKWAGWQFSAGFNRAGPVYGCQSSDLDLNIVESKAWTRWTGGSSPTEPVEELPPPPIPVIPPGVEEEDSMKIKVQPEDVWFEKVGVDVRRVGSGNEYAGLPGAEVVLNVDEMSRLVATCRYTYGAVDAGQLGGPFAAAWLAKREPVGGGGSGGEQLVRVQVDVTGP